MDSRSVAIPPPFVEADGSRTIQRRSLSHRPDQGGKLTRQPGRQPRVHHADPGVHDADPAVHDPPI